MTGRDWKEHQCVERVRQWEAILSSQGSLNESESHALAEVREFIDHANAHSESFELVVADCLPDDDDGGEEPGEMCRRALVKAEASVDHHHQITEWAMKQAEAIDDHHRQVVEWALKEVVGGVRGFGVERGAKGRWHVLMQDGSHAFSLVEGDLPDQPGAARKVVSALYSAWLDGVRGERARSAAKGAAS